MQGRIRVRSGGMQRLELSHFAKPVKGALDFRPLETVSAEEMFQADLFEAGAPQGVIHSFLRAGWRDLVLHAAAEPDWHVQKICWRMIILVGRAQAVRVN